MHFSHLLVAINILYLTKASNLEHDGSVVIKLEHSLEFEEGPVFTERGNITIHSLRLGQAIVNQKSLELGEQNKLQKLASENKFYQVRAIVEANDGSTQIFLTTLKACMLAESSLDDRLVVSLDYNGKVIAVTEIIASKSACEGALVPLSNLQHFTTTVYVRQTETGPIPDIMPFLQKLEREREAKEKGAEKDNRSFVAKYWMYIVPIVIVMVISSANTPEANQPQ